ncbi:hypothetical protein GI364_02255 [Alicyclobacillus sp. SO9]|nr:hypothetical protein GI364_02255 [Alicyclobacillus sp. SO9]
MSEHVSFIRIIDMNMKEPNSRIRLARQQGVRLGHELLQHASLVKAAAHVRLDCRSDLTLFFNFLQFACFQQPSVTRCDTV